MAQWTLPTYGVLCCPRPHPPDLCPESALLPSKNIYMKPSCYMTGVSDF